MSARYAVRGEDVIDTKAPSGQPDLVSPFECARRLNEEDLALWFTPTAIREHFDVDDDPFARWVRDDATDEQLANVGEACLSNDSLYQMFRLVLRVEVKDAMERS